MNLIFYDTMSVISPSIRSSLMSSPSSYVFAILSKASGILDLLSSNSTKHAPGSLLTTMADTISLFMVSMTTMQGETQKFINKKMVMLFGN